MAWLEGINEVKWVWVDPPELRRGRRMSPLSGTVIRDSELSPPRARRRTFLTGPWAGMSTTLARLVPATTANATPICGDCGCVGRYGYGGACRVMAQEGWGGRCPTCEHAFCACGRPVRYRREPCAVCSGGIERQANGAWRAIQPPPPRVWGGVRDADYKAPFTYAPTKLHRLGQIADIDPLTQAQLRREIWFHVNNHQPYLTVDEEGRRLFMHYHVNCWGEASLRDLSNEAMQARAAEVLDIINLDSPAQANPRGLVPISTIPHSGFRQQTSWNANAIYADQRTAQLIQSVLARQVGVGLTLPNKVVVVGAGGVGWWVATQLSLIGVRTVVSVDHDRIEASNLTRIPTSREQIRAYKVDLLRTQMSLSTWRRDIPGLSFSRSTSNVLYITDDLLEDAEVIVDTTDVIMVQQYVYDLARRLGMRYVRAGYDGGWHVTVSSRRAPDWELDRDEGYAVPSWIGGAQIAASLAVTKICRLPRLEVSFDILDWLGGLHDTSMEVSEAEYTAVAVAEEPVVMVDDHYRDDLTDEDADDLDEDEVEEPVVLAATGFDVWRVPAVVTDTVFVANNTVFTVG